MIETKKKINLAQLDQELGGKGLSSIVDGDTTYIYSPHGNIAENDLEKAIENHVALPDPQPTIEEKLSSVGLSVDDLKAALGL